MIDLIALTEEEYPAFRQRAIDSYALDQVAAGYCDQEDAKRRAAAAYQQLLKQGLATPGHYIFRLHDHGPVGYLWVQLRLDDATPSAYVYDIEIEEGHRDKGLGREAFRMLEEWSRKQGVQRIELAVVASNARAVHLYESLGFSPIRHVMRRDLAKKND